MKECDKPRNIHKNCELHMIYISSNNDETTYYKDLHSTQLHYTCRHFTSSHLNFTQIQLTTLPFALTPFKFPTAPFHLTSLHFTALLDDYRHISIPFTSFRL